MTLENLVKINQLKSEPPDKNEFEGLVKAAVDRLTDSQIDTLSFASRFDLAYSAAHGLALAALRATGHRSDKRYLVFQCLVHTTDMGKTEIRIFSACHNKRNLAEYEGHYEADEQLLTELITNTKVLLKYVSGIKL
jgi:hypothetical protein